MLRTPRVAFLLIAGLLAASLAPPEAAVRAAARHTSVIRDVMAGRDKMTPAPPEQRDTAVEPSIAVNPADANNAVAVYQEGRVDGGGAQDNGYATTFDGGRTWTYGELPGLTHDVDGPWDRASDPVAAFGPDNVVYANSLVFNEDTTGIGLVDAVVVNVSHDGGRTWSQPFYVDDNEQGTTPTNDDKNWITVDTSGAPGHHLGRVYVVWDRITPVLAAYSDDEGQTWSPTSTVFQGQGIGAIPLVVPNGDLAVVFMSETQPGEGEPGGAVVERESLLEPTPGGSNVAIAVAPGAGGTPTGVPLAFGPPITIDSYQGNEIRRQRAGGLPTAAVNRTSGRIYVGWEDGRFRRDSANDAVVTWSLDNQYQTWHTLKRVNPGPRSDSVDHYNTMLAVGADGSLRVGYLQRQEAPTTNRFSNIVDVYYQQSLDGGRTFSAPLRIDVRKRSDVRFAAFSRDGAFFGDYNQLAPAGRRTYVVTCRAYRLRKNERATFPPSVHHQRTWVTVLGGG